MFLESVLFQVKTNEQKITGAGKDVETKELSYTGGGNVFGIVAIEHSIKVFQKT